MLDKFILWLWLLVRADEHEVKVVYILSYTLMAAVVECWTYDRQIIGSTLTGSTSSNLEQVANLLYAQANSTSYPQQEGKWVAAYLVWAME